MSSSQGGKKAFEDENDVPFNWAYLKTPLSTEQAKDRMQRQDILQLPSDQRGSLSSEAGVDERYARKALDGEAHMPLRHFENARKTGYFLRAAVRRDSRCKGKASFPIDLECHGSQLGSLTLPRVQDCQVPVRHNHRERGWRDNVVRVPLRGSAKFPSH